MPTGTRVSDEDYSPSESDEDYTENEKLLLENVRRGRQGYSDEEDDILGVAVEESESDDQSDIAVSDVEGQEDDDLPDVRAWGKDKRKFYKTDYVDEDYGGFQGKDAQLAELEEEEAKNLQKQLAQQLDDDDFGLEFFAKKPEEEEKQDEVVIKTDLSMLSKKQKIQMLEKESPELFSLLEDFQVKMTNAKDYLSPVLHKYKKGEISNCKAIDFVQTQYELTLNYCTNIYMYLLLKSSKVNIQNHPVIKRLFQYRQLLLQLEPVFEEIIKPQIELLVKAEEPSEDPSGDNKSNKKRLKLLSSIVQKIQPPQLDKPKEIPTEKPKKTVKFEGIIDKIEVPSDDKPEIGDSSNDDDAEMDMEEVDSQQDTIENKNEKRPITYQMAKNKGLTPHRKKELRNPRVKHKLKYRKAVIRRKGAVREPRKELSRYGGEISGIKASVSRSVKIKS
ncbi:unnamed protein product [Phaedon cochleariae]|uniref:Sas10 C-terminal domain-containing protein n=1 Tax=Phaedon cochleariae TaxID=80249 RepID=A0A9P0DWZ5_PHACE|nr:unnamed protein product [Phaedon cochleariae]